MKPTNINTKHNFQVVPKWSPKSPQGCIFMNSIISSAYNIVPMVPLLISNTYIEKNKKEKKEKEVRKRIGDNIIFLFFEIFGDHGVPNRKRPTSTILNEFKLILGIKISYLFWGPNGDQHGDAQ